LSVFPDPAVSGKFRKPKFVKDRRAMLGEGPLVLAVREADRAAVELESPQDPCAPVGDRGIVSVDQQEAASRLRDPPPRQAVAAGLQPIPQRRDFPAPGACQSVNHRTPHVGVRLGVVEPQVVTRQDRPPDLTIARRRKPEVPACERFPGLTLVRRLRQTCPPRSGADSWF
jgi:hypothetical protein